MEEATTGRKTWLKWLLIWLGWMCVGLFFNSQAIFSSKLNEDPSFRWILFIRREAVIFNLWFALTPLMLWLNRRFRVEPARRGRRLILPILASVFVSLLHTTIYSVISHFGAFEPGEKSYREDFIYAAQIYTHFNLMCYWVFFGITSAVDYYGKFRERDLLASQLEARLAQSQLQLLKTQLHPHFLFNTLNTISILMETDVKAANKMLVRLSDLLRVALEEVGAQEVSLRQEIDFLQRYLEIEQIRFRDRLKVNLEIEPRALDAQVPNLILQPLVENAIRHGIAPKLSGGVLEIGAKREREMLKIYVRDNGPGINGKVFSETQKGIGLGNTRARLAQIYGVNHLFHAGNAETGGFEATVIIPFRTAEELNSEEQGFYDEDSDVNC